jgi:hypothetical protein
MNIPETNSHELVASKQISKKIPETEYFGNDQHGKSILFSDSTVKAKPKKIKRLWNKFDNATDSISERIGRPFKTYHNGTYLAGEYTLFGLGVGSTALAYIGLNNFIKLVAPFFILAFWLFMFAALLAYIAMDKIIYKKLPHKLAPHGFVLHFAICLICVPISLLLAFIIAFLTGSLAAAIAGWALLLSLSLYIAFTLVTKSLHDQ